MRDNLDLSPPLLTGAPQWSSLEFRDWSMACQEVPRRQDWIVRLPARDFFLFSFFLSPPPPPFLFPSLSVWEKQKTNPTLYSFYSASPLLQFPGSFLRQSCYFPYFFARRCVQCYFFISTSLLFGFFCFYSHAYPPPPPPPHPTQPPRPHYQSRHRWRPTFTSFIPKADHSNISFYSAAVFYSFPFFSTHHM